MPQPDFSHKDERGHAKRGHNKLLCPRTSRTAALLAMTLLLLFLPAAAQAACTNPAGQNGDMVYNADQNVPQVCSNGSWVALGVLNPAAGGPGCSNPAGVMGDIVYNTDIHKPQYCDGDDWVEMIGTVGGGPVGPSGCENPGDQCGDNLVYAGYHPLLSGRLYIHPNNQSNGAWSSVNVDTGADDEENGKVNQDWIVNNATITDYPAFKECDDLNQAASLGYTDWYLPSRVEMAYIWAIKDNLTASGSVQNFTADEYWTSTEASSTTAVDNDFSDNRQSNSLKSEIFAVRCVRMD